MKITKNQLRRIIREEKSSILSEQPISGEQAIQMQRDQEKPGIARAVVRRQIPRGEKIWAALASLVDQAMDQAREESEWQELADDLRGIADDVEDSMPDSVYENKSRRTIKESVTDMESYQSQIQSLAENYAWQIAEKMSGQFAEDMSTMFVTDPDIFTQAQDEWESEVDYAAEIVVDDLSSRLADPLKEAIKPVIEEVIAKIETALHNGEYARY
tara:strand:- start:285 stop:929 length:645 start_codon:yes stop_codon:yes gene_type:complete